MSKNQPGTVLRVFGYVQGLAWVLAGLLLMAGCPPRPYYAHVLDVTDINTRGVKWVETPKKAHIWAPSGLAHNDFYNQVDAYITELSACLQRIGVKSEPIKFERVYVYVPKNWYNSKCSDEQLIPSKVNPELCNAKFKKKGMPLLPKECHWVTKPTQKCPCVCNVRSAIVDMHVVASPPNMKLFKAELARLVLYSTHGHKYNNPWVKQVSQCLK